MKQGLKWGQLVKKTRGQKSHATVPSSCWKSVHPPSYESKKLLTSCWYKYLDVTWRTACSGQCQVATFLLSKDICTSMKNFLPSLKKALPNTGNHDICKATSARIHPKVWNVDEKYVIEVGDVPTIAIFSWLIVWLIYWTIHFCRK